LITGFAVWQQVLLVMYGIVVALCLVRHFIWSWAMRHTPFLSPATKGMDADQGPLVSVLVPAKDEEKGIASCLLSLLRQEYPRLEVLVADDRSVDRTAEIVREIAGRDNRVRLVQITELPEGWTGKTNALQQLQTHARGEWLLFVDADTRHHPRCVSVALRNAIDNGTDMLSLMPALDMRSFWECVVQPFAAMCLMILYPLPQVNDPKRRDMGFANGQFILVRRRAYDAIGQHTRVKHRFVEDIHLGRQIREEGLSLRVSMAPDLFGVRMYASLAEIQRGWARILYSAVDGRASRLWVLQAFILIFRVLSYVVLAVTGGMVLMGWGSAFVWTLLGLGVAHEVLQQTMFARIYQTTRSRLDYLAFRPLAVVVMLLVVGRAIRMCRTHVVTWRGTSYGQALQSAR
jgi:glycosyltransferase involved in cell wall biosynthesis